MRPTFDQSESITTAVAAVLEYTAGWKRGMLLTWDIIRKVTGYDRDHEQWGGFVRRLKQQFRKKRGIELFHFGRNDGFTLPTFDQQVHTIPLLRQSKARRQAFFIQRSLDALPADDLTERQRLRMALSRQAARETARVARKAKRQANEAQETSRPTQRPRPGHMSK
jgi:hypothetical protein